MVAQDRLQWSVEEARRRVASYNAASLLGGSGGREPRARTDPSQTRAAAAVRAVPEVVALASASDLFRAIFGEGLNGAKGASKESGMKESLRNFIDWLAMGSSLLWLAGVAFLFLNSALSEGWWRDLAALVVFGLAPI